MTAHPRTLTADRFEADRLRLRAVAHRLLGSLGEADDAVQETWLRASQADVGEVENLTAWLTTVVSRVSLNMLRSRRTRREEPLELQPGEEGATGGGGDPAEEALLADEIGVALLVVLDTLGPDERLAFVLHDLFAVPFDEIGQILGKSTAATKMLASRARRKVQAIERPTGVGQERREVVQAFLAAARRGDFEGLLRVLDPDVKLTVDSPSGVVVTLGATQVAAGARLSAGAATQGRAVLVNGLPGIVSWREDGTPFSVVAFTVVDGRISDITVVIDPAKLALMNLPDPA